MSDWKALNEIHDLMDGREWNVDTLNSIAEIVRQTGREIRDVEDVQVPEKSCRNCHFCGMDMDMEPYCSNTNVLSERSKATGIDYPYGLVTSAAIQTCELRFWTERQVPAADHGQ